MPQQTHDMATMMAMMERMGMGNVGAMMGMDGGGGMGIAPAGDHSTPEELVALVLRPHGGGMPMGKAGRFLARVGQGALYYCHADQWDVIGGFGALAKMACTDGARRHKEVVDAMVARVDAVPTLIKWIAYMPAFDGSAREGHRKWSNRVEKRGLDGLDYLCEKGTELEELISGVDATTPITPEQASPAYACVMYEFLSLLRWLLRPHMRRVVQSKHAMRLLDRLASLLDSRLVTPSDMGGEHELATEGLSLLSWICRQHAGALSYTRNTHLTAVKATHARVSAAVEKHDPDTTEGFVARENLQTVTRLLQLLLSSSDENAAAAAPDAPAMTAFRALGKMAVERGVISVDGYPGAYNSAARQLDGAYIDDGARDAAACGWLGKHVLTKGTAVVLAGLGKAECNGREGVVIGSFRLGVDGIRRVPLDLGGGEKLAVPVQKLLLCEGVPSEDATRLEAARTPDGETPVLAGTGKNAARNRKKREKMKQKKAAEVDDESEPPPLQ